MFAIAGIGVALGQPFAISLVAGMGFAMSSTAIGLATLTEKHLLPTPGGQASFAVLLFQDIAVIPLMLVLSLMAPERAGAPVFDLAAAGRAVGLIVVLIVAGRFLLRPLLRYVANTGLREIFVAFSLLLVIGIALLMQSVGLSAALGTFLAGVLLADSEYRHELELDIEPFKGLLLGLFFISVGMSVDLGLFMRIPLVVLGIAAGIVAVKVGMLYAIARSFRLCGADGILFALALSQVGEFAFVLFGVAASEHILSRETANILNAAVAASMLTTPLLMILYEKVIVPRLKLSRPRAADVIDEENPVIVAGYGRFGQVVTRLLKGRGIGTTVIDHDPNQIELVRRFGQKAYYGDATRLDLLRSAGAGKAKLLVIAVDDKDAALATAKLAREHFPGPRASRARLQPHRCVRVRRSGYSSGARNVRLGRRCGRSRPQGAGAQRARSDPPGKRVPPPRRGHAREGRAPSRRREEAHLDRPPGDRGPRETAAERAAGRRACARGGCLVVE